MSLRAARKLAQQHGHRVQTGPLVEPVTLGEVRTIIRTPPTEEDTFITDCIVQAREMFEAVTSIACITQTWKLTLDRWPSQIDPWWDGVREFPISELNGNGNGPPSVEMPRYPLQSVDSVTTYDTGDAATSLTVNSVFFTDTESFPGRINLRAGQTWPIALRHTNAIEIVYTAGFGDSASDVPASIKRAVGNAAAFLYENRGTGCSSGAVLAASGALQIASEYVNLRL